MNSIRTLFDPRPTFAAAQLLLLLVLVSITRSPPLTSLFELMLVGLFAFSPPLRSAFFSVIKDPRGMAALVVLVWICIATLWADVGWDVRLDKLWSWRKLWFLPMALAVFGDRGAKLLVAGTVLVTATLYMVLSWASYWGLVELWAPANWLIRNHATQGVYFCLAAMLALFAIVRCDLSRLQQLGLVVVIFGLVANQLVVLTGRTGYLTLLVLSIASAWYLIPKYKLALTGLVGLLVISGLALSPQSSSRISLAMDNALTAFDDNRGFSSLGIRVVFWKNTIELIVENPLLGTGTGGFGDAYANHVSAVEGWRGTVTDDAHQQYLQFAAEFGLVGLALFLGLIWLCMESRIDSAFVFLGLAFGLSYLANGFANGHFNGFTEGRLIWIFWGAMLSGTTYRFGGLVRRQ